MQESTKARTSHSTIKNEELKRILENIFYTEDLISELTTERDSLRLLLSKEGIYVPTLPTSTLSTRSVVRDHWI